jgi:putative aminopeptidase FrvX
MNWTSLLTDLVTLPGLSGHEEPVARFIRESFRNLGATVRTDRVGNVIVTLVGRDPAAPSAMVFAHLDQLGFMVRRVERSGFLRLERLGGVPERTLPGTAVTVTTASEGTLSGVIGVKSHHLTQQGEKGQVLPTEALYVDIGARDADEVERLGVRVGAPVVYAGNPLVLTGGRFAAPALDNRAGCAILVALAERLVEDLTDATVHLVATVQEEFNLRGAMMAARSLEPDLAIALDIALACDTPDLDGRLDIDLGGGPVLNLYNFHGRGTLNGTIPPRRLVAFLEEAASAEGITYQRSAATGLLTDAAYVQFENGGIPTIDVGFPLRYSHSPLEVVDVADLEATTRALLAALRRLRPGTRLDRSEPDEP